ncbi:MAG TPA: hypothetical protein VNZ64_11045 [Candidatus Acidoferrum sp.]|nr:hypothetical protein [Candidatus Acidoferrum sp.]
MNQDLLQLHAQLLAQHQALYERLDEVTDATAAKIIITEMQEILHRIDLVEGLLFRQTTGALQESLQKVDAADTELTDALSSVNAAADIIAGVSKYLAVVDQAIDLAKTLGPAAV